MRNHTTRRAATCAQTGRSSRRSTSAKLLIAAAALGLPMAAQAQDSNVTLYGRINLDMEVVNGLQPNGTNPHVFRVSSNTSRFGLRGTEAMGNGLNAIFQLESSASIDAGGGTIAGRESYVGLQSQWGTVKMGFFVDPYDDLHPIFGDSPTFLTSIFSTVAVWGQGAAGTVQNGAIDARVPNSVRYDTPVLSGATFSVQYGSTEAASPGAPNGGVLTAGTVYNNGPLVLGAAYSNHEHVRGLDLDDRGWTIVGAYNFGVVRPALLYEEIRYETPTGVLKRKFWAASVIVPMAGGLWYAFYGFAGDGTGSAANGTRVGNLVKGSDTGTKQIELSYTYPLSKRTSIYGGYVTFRNDANAPYTFNINTYPIAPGAKPSGWVLGMINFF